MIRKIFFIFSVLFKVHYRKIYDSTCQNKDKTELNKCLKCKTQV